MNMSIAAAEIRSAPSVSQKNRRGRKRRGRYQDREPNGQMSRTLVRELEGYAPAAVARLAAKAIQGVEAPLWGTPLGRLFLAGRLLAPELEAGRRWGSIAVIYHAAMSSPAGMRSVSLGGSPGGTPIDPDSEDGKIEARAHREAIEKYERAHTLLVGMGDLTLRDVVSLCEADEWPAGYDRFCRAKAGLKLLAEFWRLADEP